jgi:UDP-glucose 4-epimerase
VAAPLPYYSANVAGTVTLLEALTNSDCRRFVFSSSATVYGDPSRTPIPEDAPRAATNPYGRTKLMIEHILEDLAASDPSWVVAILRYFNPVGAHPSGRIGEDPAGEPDNLMPVIARVALGRRPDLAVFGDDYDTPDGTGLRDYLHVVDLARAHLAALDWTADRAGDRSAGGAARRSGVCEAFNLGTGRGHSVLEVMRAFAKASGRPIPFRIAPRRPGDVARLYADPARAGRDLGWRAEKGLAEMCADGWRWQSLNPHGYRAAAAGAEGRRRGMTSDGARCAAVAPE